MNTNNELLRKADLEKFIENIHIISSRDIPVLTSDMENLSGFYDELIQSEEGQALKDDDTQCNWVGSHPLIDIALGLNPNKYNLSLIRKFETVTHVLLLT